ncbi:MAG: type II toxin-antitoxin system VapC family toxin [Actinomycetota bacterium]|nr:type II toxin-antitoxin system VapC family toxin [Actinomycetota bacterium]
MSAERATYLDSSAIVKLVVSEPESTALRRYLRRKGPLVTSALARTEIARALLPLGAVAIAQGAQVLLGLEVVRVSDRILRTAGAMLSYELRSLDAIHLATAVQLEDDLSRVCTYDHRMATAAAGLGFAVAAPA